MGKVIHEETRRVWRFEDGEYLSGWEEDEVTDDPYPMYEYWPEGSANVLEADSFREESINEWNLAKLKGNGRPVTVKITVEEVDNE